MNFADRLIERVRALGHSLCVGIDPYWDRVPMPLRRRAMAPQDPGTAEGVEEFCCQVVDLARALLPALTEKLHLIP